MSSALNETWKRIAGLHVTEVGDIGMVWTAHDKETDLILVYDCAIFRHLPPSVIAEGVNARGRWIPVAWEAKAKPTTDMLLERGANIIDPFKEDDAVAEIWSKEIKERLVTGRLKIETRLAEWKDEYKTFYRDDATVPRDSHPLMAATRYAVAQRKDWARSLRSTRKKRPNNYPRLAII